MQRDREMGWRGGKKSNNSKKGDGGDGDYTLK